MNLDWQNIAALSLVALAGCYLARELRRAWTKRGKSGCGGCEKCPAPQTDSGHTLVTLDRLTTSTVPDQSSRRGISHEVHPHVE